MVNTRTSKLAIKRKVEQEQEQEQGKGRRGGLTEMKSRP